MMPVRRWILVLCLLLSGALPIIAASEPHRLLLVLSDNTAPYQETRENFERSLRMLAGPAIPYELEVIVPDANGIVAAMPSGFAPDLVIPVGVDATRAVHEQLPDLPVFSILITREAHDRIHDGRHATALFLEQPARLRPGYRLDVGCDLVVEFRNRWSSNHDGHKGDRSQIPC